MHPLIAPGTHVLRRGPDEIQFGLDPAGAVVVAGDPPTAGARSHSPELVTTLVAAGLAEPDDASLRTALPGHSDNKPWLRHTLAALARRVGGELAGAVASRASHQVVVTAFGHPIGESLRRDVVDLCARAGLLLPSPRRPGPPRRGTQPPRQVHLLLGVGEPTRDLLDPWVHQGLPHLVVRLVEGRAVLGPFVAPGQTACLRCLDVYRTEKDPAWPLLVEQYARATRMDRADGIPEPVDAALAAVAVGWAVRDLATYVEGGRPSAWSTTIRLGPALEEVERQRWPAHPHCGCSWT